MDQQPHRDIFVGIVATELEKDGYFGVEIELYGFIIFGEKRKKFVFEEKESMCVMRYYELLKKGVKLSPYMAIKKRVIHNQKCTINEVEDELKEKLNTAYANGDNAIAFVSPVGSEVQHYVERSDRKLYGFVWANENREYKSYCNVVLLATIQKYINLKQAGNACSDIIEKIFSCEQTQLTKEKETFCREMLFDMQAIEK